MLLVRQLVGRERGGVGGPLGRRVAILVKTNARGLPLYTIRNSGHQSVSADAVQDAQGRSILSREGPTLVEQTGE